MRRPTTTCQQSVFSPMGAWNNGPNVCLLACVASVSSRGSSRKLGQEQKKHEWRGRGRRPKEPFFCFRSNFRPITRLETLATQVICLQALTLSLLSPRVFFTLSPNREPVHRLLLPFRSGFRRRSSRLRRSLLTRALKVWLKRKIRDCLQCTLEKNITRSERRQVQLDPSRAFSNTDLPSGRGICRTPNDSKV